MCKTYRLHRSLYCEQFHVSNLKTQSYIIFEFWTRNSTIDNKLIYLDKIFTTHDVISSLLPIIIYD